ncbi:MAG: hypothetical protein KC416_01935, partial [Myxococcales bacterium]|nr:hypothetical protein [Myxococcales bacterium]
TWLETSAKNAKEIPQSPFPTGVHEDRACTPSGPRSRTPGETTEAPAPFVAGPSLLHPPLPVEGTPPPQLLSHAETAALLERFAVKLHVGSTDHGNAPQVRMELRGVRGSPIGVHVGSEGEEVHVKILGAREDRAELERMLQAVQQSLSARGIRLGSAEWEEATP